MGEDTPLPGGLARFEESDEHALLREVEEETGLQIESFQLLCRYFSGYDIPCHISVFAASASGQLQNSWEGEPEWVSIVKLQNGVIGSQRRIAETLLSQPLA
jgi:8-oxo-dGTP pyrophosphatase MutT (NUDIX family)